MSITTIVSTTAQLLATLAGAHGGDMIRLAPGTYSNVSIYDKNVPQAQVTPGAQTRVFITSEYGNNPAVLTDLTVNESTGLYFENLTFSTATTAPTVPGSGDTTVPFKVYSSSQMTFARISVTGSPLETYLTDVTGMTVQNSSHVAIQNSSFTYLHDGISQKNDTWTTFSSNSFSHISDDGIRGGGSSEMTITGNSFTSQHEDASDTDHADAIQFWTTNTIKGVSNITITNNTITRGDGNAVQGIFLNDDVGDLPFTNVLIQGNSITGELYNGIAVYDGISTKILNNTVVSYPDYNSAIKVLNSSNTIVSGNSAESFDYPNDTGLISTSNIINSPVPFPDENGLNIALTDAVPEPSIWSMMLMGAALCGGLLRKRRLRVRRCL